jgi:glycolate oxidase FAD binding subunit
MLRPTTEEEVADLVREADAAGQALIPRGGGTKLGWGRPAQGEFLSLRELDRMIALEPGDFVCVAQAGMRLADLDAALRAERGHRQRLMLDPPHGGDATLGGIVATNASGPLRHRYGAPRDLVIGARLVLADGTRAKTGGRVVKNVAGYDLARLLCGSLGSLAVITELAFRLHPVPEATVAVLLETRDAGRAAAFATAVRGTGLAPTMVEVAWPDGRVMVRFDSTPAAAREQALAAAAFDPDARALSDSDRRMLVPRLADRPWTDEGAVLAVGVPLAAVADLLRLSEEYCDDLVLRAGVGVGEARLRPDVEAVEAFRDGVVALGGHVAPRRLPPALAEVAWPEPDAVSRSLTLAIKHQLDPNGTLAPGRLAEAA